MPYLDDPTLALFRADLNLGLYFHLETDPPLRLWSGVGDIEQELPDVDVGLEVYKSVRMGDLPDFELMLNGGAERGEFSLEGVSAEALREIAGTDPVVLGVKLHIGIAAHDAAWQPATPILPLTDAIADFWAMSRTRVEGRDTPVQRLTLSVGFGETGRTRPRRAVYSDTQQQALFPGDTFCIDVPRYHNGYIIAWPRF